MLLKAHHRNSYNKQIKFQIKRNQCTIYNKKENVRKFIVKIANKYVEWESFIRGDWKKYYLCNMPPHCLSWRKWKFQIFNKIALEMYYSLSANDKCSMKVWIYM